jgi:hypothetical protein
MGVVIIVVIIIVIIIIINTTITTTTTIYSSSTYLPCFILARLEGVVLLGMKSNWCALSLVTAHDNHQICPLTDRTLLTSQYINRPLAS